MKIIRLFNRIVWMAGMIMLQPLLASAQKIQLLDSGNSVSLRGLSVVNKNVFWLSGNKGTVGITHNGGKKIQWINVTGYEGRDFRDIEAFDANTALIMAIDTPAIILKTSDRGKSWRKVFEDKRSGMFLDAMYFQNEQQGIVAGDPVDGRFFLAATKDGGESWSVLKASECPVADSGEALFAASGSNIILSKEKIFLVSGGTTSHMMISIQKNKLPLLQGKSSAGANAIDIAEDGRMIMVGGDFSADKESKDNCAITDDAGKTFRSPIQSPYGYKSSISYIGDKTWICCGTSGIDISTDHGMNWKHVSDQGFHVVKKSKKGNKIFLAGSNGKVGEISLHH
jgi:photosystem II stability/assembly factor-like uncharacterized protein